MDDGGRPGRTSGIGGEAQPPIKARPRVAARNRLGERDGWICGFCRTRVDKVIRWPHPVSPSVGHILWRGGGGSDDPSNLRIEHLACNMKNAPPLRAPSPHPLRVAEREAAGLPPYTAETWEEERQKVIREALENPKPPLTLEECIWRYWLPGMQSWTRWHAENPGVCSCTFEASSALCWPPIPEEHPRAASYWWALQWAREAAEEGKTAE